MVQDFEGGTPRLYGSINRLRRAGRLYCTSNWLLKEDVVAEQILPSPRIIIGCHKSGRVDKGFFTDSCDILQKFILVSEFSHQFEVLQKSLVNTQLNMAQLAPNATVVITIGNDALKDPRIYL